jgi:outer membrane protein insertion porin family
MGKRDGQDSLGGELAWGAGLSMMGPLWWKGWKPEWGVRWHGFLNGGKVVGWDRGEFGIYHFKGIG